jgi:GMP synthase (glutamine-hydrolysing)
MSRVLVVLHAKTETPGSMRAVLREKNIKTDYVPTFEGQHVPREIGTSSGLILMGGPMGVYEHDRYGFIREEIHLIENALQENRPILGVCLGSQLLASALGATVSKGKKLEIGWHEVVLTPSGEADRLFSGSGTGFVAFHWHGDVFSLPRGAAHLATSTATEYQAFRYGNSAYGLLFHMEVTKGIINGMIRAFPRELKEAGVHQEDFMLDSKKNLPRLQHIGYTAFSRWADLVNGSR